MVPYLPESTNVSGTRTRRAMPFRICQVIIAVVVMTVRLGASEAEGERAPLPMFFPYFKAVPAVAVPTQQDLTLVDLFPEPVLHQCVMPECQPPAGLQTTGTALQVAITAAAGTQIYYTVDGSDPYFSRTVKLYSKPIPVSTTTTIKTFAYQSGKDASRVQCALYRFVDQAPSQTLHVLAGFTGVSDGSQSKPFATITAAVAAAKPGDVIKVAQGDYDEKFLLKTSLHFFGGFNRDFSIRNHERFPSRLIGHYSGADTPIPEQQKDAIFLQWDNDQDVTIDGFTLIGGEYGVFSRAGTMVPAVHTLRFYNNIVESCGTQANARKRPYNEVGGGVNVEYPKCDCVGNVFHHNIGREGSAYATFGSRKDSTVLFDQNLVLNNWGHENHAGAVLIATVGSVISNSFFAGNRGGVGVPEGCAGGALACWLYNGRGDQPVNDDESITISRCIFTRNHAHGYGSAFMLDERGVFNLDHLLIYDNYQGPSGTSIWFGDVGPKGPSTRGTMNHVTVVDSHNDAYGSFLTYNQNTDLCRIGIANSVLWNLGKRAIKNQRGPDGPEDREHADIANSIWLTITTSVVETGFTQNAADHNTNAAPTFMDAANHDYRLTKDSAGRHQATGGEEPGFFGHTAQSHYP